VEGGGGGGRRFYHISKEMSRVFLIIFFLSYFAGLVNPCPLSYIEANVKKNF